MVFQYFRQYQLYVVVVFVDSVTLTLSLRSILMVSCHPKWIRCVIRCASRVKTAAYCWLAYQSLRYPSVWPLHSWISCLLVNFLSLFCNHKHLVYCHTLVILNWSLNTVHSHSADCLTLAWNTANAPNRHFWKIYWKYIQDGKSQKCTECVIPENQFMPLDWTKICPRLPP